MQKPNEIPTAVIAGLVRYAGQHKLDAKELQAELQWDALNRNYYFLKHGMYHGVELDGHIHT